MSKRKDTLGAAGGVRAKKCFKNAGTTQQKASEFLLLILVVPWLLACGIHP
jgi:hypothetical protein